AECRPDGAPPPIGRPFANTRVHVLDADGQLAPIGAPGELYTGGVGVARGYLNRPELTAERFVPDPFGAPGERLYRTRDRARWRPEGQSESRGRVDGQIKLRGFRGERGGVEAALAEDPSVLTCAVVAHGEGVDRRLLAYVVPAEAESFSTSRLRERLAS